jgi:uncharacterized protein (TIGR03067 family)
MIRLASIFFTSIVATLVVAAPVPKAVKNQERDKVEILGEWLEPADKGRIWWFKEDGTAGGGDIPKPTRKGLYRIDATTDPKSLDWSDDGGRTWQLGVYRIENDVLTVNIGANASDIRPVSFDETPRSHKISATRKKAEN